VELRLNGILSKKLSTVKAFCIPIQNMTFYKALCQIGQGAFIFIITLQIKNPDRKQSHLDIDKKKS
jgi:hypothetical protein